MKRKKSIRKKRGGAYREPEPEPEPEPISEGRAYTEIKLISENIIKLKRSNASRPILVREINKRKSLIENYEQTFGKPWIDRGWPRISPSMNLFAPTTSPITTLPTLKTLAARSLAQNPDIIIKDKKELLARNKSLFSAWIRAESLADDLQEEIDGLEEEIEELREIKRRTLSRLRKYIDDDLSTFPKTFDESNCSICLEPMHHTNSIKLKCGHRFHKDCIATYMTERSNCPLCRAEIEIGDSPSKALNLAVGWPPIG